MSRLRTHLLLPIAAAVIPLASFGLFAVHALWQSERAYDDSRAKARVQAIAASLGKDVQGSIQLLSFIASSRRISAGSMESFTPVAEDALKIRGDWQNLILLDRTGDQLFNSRWPPGRRPNRMSAPHIQQVFQSGQPTVSGMFMAPGSGDWRVSVNVPVTRSGTVEYVLVAGLKLDQLDVMLSSYVAQAGGFAVLLDSNHNVISRSDTAEKRRGTPVNEELSRAIRGRLSGSEQIESARLGPLAGAWAAVPATQWTIFIGEPLTAVRSELARHLTFVALAGLGALLVGLVGALLMSRKIAVAVASAAGIARKVPEGKCGDFPDTGILELEALNDALARSAARISRETEARSTAEESLNALLQREREAREAAEYANRAKDHFLAMLGHELRNPLAAVSNAATVAGWGAATPVQRDNALAVIRRQTGNLTTIVNDLLDASRVMSGKIRLQREAINLGLVVADAVRALELGGTFAARTLRVEIADVWVEGDRARLEQVVHNLLTNAATYTAPGGTVTVRTGIAGNDAVLEVSDEGIGIAEADLAHVFDLFFQAEQDSHRPYSGLGIGLTVVKQLVTLHGGSVMVRSAGLGKGAAFVVQLPAVPAPDHARQPRLDKPEPRHILIVEDNPDARESLKQVLALDGHTVTVAPDAETALRCFEEQVPDIAIVDIGLPRMNGYDLARAIRARHGGAVRLIALSGYGSEADKENAARAGFDAHLTKPADGAVLNGMLRRNWRGGAPVGRA